MAFKAGESETCPHCRTGVRFDPCTLRLPGYNSGAVATIMVDAPSKFWLELNPAACPSCGQLVISVARHSASSGQYSGPGVVFPKGVTRSAPAEVSQMAASLAKDFGEAAAVISMSHKASAALSRRCLQFILVNAAGAKKHNLAEQIDEVLPSLPAQIAENVDAIRHIGNFAAHPMKSSHAGEVVEVEDGEAEWLLEVLEDLMEFYYVAPTKAAGRRDALNKKLSELGKPQLKKP